MLQSVAALLELDRAGAARLRLAAVAADAPDALPAYTLSISEVGHSK